MRFYEDNREMNELWNTESGLIDDLIMDMEQASHNQYVASMDEATLSKWEVILGIIKGIDDSLELRRVRVGSRLISRSPVNLGLLQERLDFLLGKSNSKVEFSDSTVFITLFKGINQSLFYEFDLLLRGTIPANMYHKVDLEYDLQATVNLANYSSSSLEYTVSTMEEILID